MANSRYFSITCSRKASGSTITSKAIIPPIHPPPSESSVIASRRFQAPRTHHPFSPSHVTPFGHGCPSPFRSPRSSPSPAHDVGDHARCSHRDYDRQRSPQPSGTGAMTEDAADLRSRYRRSHEQHTGKKRHLPRRCLAHEACEAGEEHKRQVAPDDHTGGQSEDMEHQGNEDERAPLPDQPPQKTDRQTNR